MISIIYSFMIIVSIAECLALVTNTQWNPLEQRLIDFLEEWRDGSGFILGQGYSMPSLDLIVIPSFEGEFRDSGVKLSYSTSDLVLEGLNNFSIEKVSASVENLNASMEVLIPTLILNADHYDLSGRAYLLYPLKGSGKLTVEFQDTWLSGYIRLGSNTTSTMIQNVALDFDVGAIKVDLAGSSWPINSVLNKQGKNILAKYHDYIVSAAEEYFTLYSNDYLSKTSVSELLDPIN